MFRPEFRFLVLAALVSHAPGLPLAPLPTSSSTITMPLRKMDSTNGNGESFYIGSLSIGQPAQEMRVLFDTSSGHVLVPHLDCQESYACKEHKRYSPWESQTSMDVDAKGGQLRKEGRLAIAGQGPKRQIVKMNYQLADLGEGLAAGLMVNDQICLHSGSDRACTNATMIAATKMDDVPFRAMPGDAIIGLGLTGLSAKPHFNFLARMTAVASNMLPQFGISLGRERGEVLFGGHDRAHLSAPLQWFPVARPEEGYWQVEIKSVIVNGIIVDDCKAGCRGIIDTGSSRIGLEKGKLEPALAALAAVAAPGGGCEGNSMSFDLGTMNLTLGVINYAGADCKPMLGVLPVLDEAAFQGVYTLGEVLLRKYYAAFDWQLQKLGFAPHSYVDAFADESTPTCDGGQRDATGVACARHGGEL